MRHVGLVALAVLGCCPGALAADLPAAVPVPATAPVVAPLPQESGRFTLIEENDALMPRPTDRWYTQGLELNYLSAPIAGTGRLYVDVGTAEGAVTLRDVRLLVAMLEQHGRSCVRGGMPVAPRDIFIRSGEPQDHGNLVVRRRTGLSTNAPGHQESLVGHSMIE